MSLDFTPWGKYQNLPSPYPLIWHAIDTMAVAEKIWDNYLTSGQKSVIAESLECHDDLECAKAFFVFIAGIHDIGKLSDSFQRQNIRAWATVSSDLVDASHEVTENIKHPLAGELGLRLLLPELGFTDNDIFSITSIVSEIVTGHHGRYSESPWRYTPAEGTEQLLGGAVWVEQQRHFLNTIFRLAGRPHDVQEISAPGAILITGGVILSDWVASQTHFILPLLYRNSTSIDDHYAASSHAAEAELERIGLIQPQPRRVDPLTLLPFDPPNWLQKSIASDLAAHIESNTPGCLVVTAPPGEGKTEATHVASSIFEQAGSVGLVSLLPTQGIADQQWGRLHQWASTYAETDTVTLAHSNAWLHEQYNATNLTAPVATGDDDCGDGDAPDQWLRRRHRPLLAPFVSSTIDQVLQAVQPSKFNMLRLFAVSGKTVVVDEAHTYDPYMQALVGRALEWLGAFGTNVILLSATLPPSISTALVSSYLRGAGRRRSALNKLDLSVPYPGWLYAPASGQPIRFTAPVDDQPRSDAYQRHPASITTEPVVSTSANAIDDTNRLDTVIDHVARVGDADGGCAAVVCNTVDDAQATYQSVHQHFEQRGIPVEILLIHARMPDNERRARLERLDYKRGRKATVEAGERLIVVGTPLLESALDYDCDLMISDLAPMAMLLQRLGRCWRHRLWRPAWSTEPRLIVLNPNTIPRRWGGRDGIYHHHLLHQTTRTLDGLTTVSIPDDVQRLVESVHDVDLMNCALIEDDTLAGDYMITTETKRQQGVRTAIPGPNRAYPLSLLHPLQPREERKLSARLGIDTVRVLACFRQHDGTLTFDTTGVNPVPDIENDNYDWAVRAIMARTFNLERSMTIGLPQPHRPTQWDNDAHLKHVTLLAQPIDRQGRACPVRTRDWDLDLDPDLGLVRHRRA
ncbi:CRISPR-associated helicase/endonuclease Cas3 [Haloglycomyces albus]|uniref:CRISPR-associated helicase/endonuclease Cas3 n=1 Tax=Haloglycomyces albus TaxID=526067 RepID=UPI00046D6DA2|nr:CRISPR-associated helicase/endonuclease Cas3 [Haloglycomyces albus]